MKPLRAEHGARMLRLFRDGADEPCLIQHAAADRRPFIHPIRTPDGSGVLTEDAPPHHPWQHGLYTGLNLVNGVGFWTEGLLADRRAEDGTFHPDELAAPVLDGSDAAWRVETDWRGPDGGDLLRERQEWRFADRGSTFVLDLQWTLRARVDLAFGAHQYGGLTLCPPFATERGGRVISSEGLIGPQAEQQRARWVAMSMPLPGAGQAGAAVMDHPGNPGHPVPWRVDGKLRLCPSRCIAGAWRLAAGEECRFRHRVVVFAGETEVDRVEAGWREFAGIASARSRS